MNLSISDLMTMQKNLFHIHSKEWPPMEPEQGKQMMLYMVEEMGESISILKKKGDRAVVDEPSVREAFLEEMSDILMYYIDTLLRYHVTPEEISEAYYAKHNRNMGRDYAGEYKEKYHG